MDMPVSRGFSIIETNPGTEMMEAQFANAIVATHVNPSTVSPNIIDVRLAIQNQFHSQIIPVAITRFRSDFVLQFATLHEKDMVTSSRVLHGHGFTMDLVPWTNHYGGTIVEWSTAVSIDISGFPSHAFQPTCLRPLLSDHCSIQAYAFNKSRGMCRVDAYALNTQSIPHSGYIGFQYPQAQGVRNVVFPVTMKTYPYSEAPVFRDDAEQTNASTDLEETAHEFGVDPELLREAYDQQDRDEERYASGSHSTSSDEVPYLLRDCSPARSFESDRSWKLY